MNHNTYFSYFNSNLVKPIIAITLTAIIVSYSSSYFQKKQINLNDMQKNLDIAMTDFENNSQEEINS